MDSMATNGHSGDHSNGQTNGTQVVNGTNGHHIDNSYPNKKRLPSRLYNANAPPDLSELEALCSQSTNPQDYPLTTSIQSNIPIYNLSTFDPSTTSTTTSLQEEWHHILHH